MHSSILSVSGVYAGWPANYGIWAHDGIIRTGGFVGQFLDVRDREGRRLSFHPYNYQSNLAGSVQFASFDGGQSWVTESGPTVCPEPGYLAHDQKVRRDAVIGGLPIASPVEYRGSPVDFLDPANVMLFGRTRWSRYPRSWWVLSRDGGVTWSNPYQIPNCTATLAGVSARSGWVRMPNGNLLLGLTVMRENGQEGRTELVETDGKKWNWLGEVNHAANGPVFDGVTQYAIMSSAVYVGPQPPNMLPQSQRRRWDVLLAVRTRSGHECAIKIYRVDSATGYSELGGVIETGRGGNPGWFVRTRSGRNILVYGHRGSLPLPGLTPKPGGIRYAEVSDDGDVGQRFVLRQAPAGEYDFGYCTAVENPIKADEILAVYYWAGRGDRRSIEQTRFEIG